MNTSFTKEIDLSYSLGIMDHLISFGSNPDLGFRTSGSAAEFAAADFLYEELKQIGMHNVRKEVVPADNFEFKHASLTYQTASREARTVTLSSFQTNCLAEQLPVRIVYAGKGTSRDYQKLSADVTGAYVLVDINMKEEWAGCWPLEEARAHGAAGIILVQTAGYCTYSPQTLGIQGIATTADFPALSMSVHDASLLKQELALCGNSVAATLDADVRVSTGGITQNIIGEIPGKIPEVIYLIGHYDAYFRAFSDNTSGIGCILGICRALVRSGYQPNRTLRVVLHGAEEWGASGTRYHWARGAWLETRKHPEWGENGFFLLNLDGGVCCGTADKAVVRTSYSAREGIQQLGQGIQETCYPFGAIAPMWTWTESYMYATLGIPTIESFYEGAGADFWPSYHSSSDTREACNYSDEAFFSSHVLYGTLLQRLDSLLVRPLDFQALFSQLQASLEAVPLAHSEINELLQELTALTKKVTAQTHHWLLPEAQNKKQKAQSPDFSSESYTFNAHISKIFQTAFCGLFGIDWDEQLAFLHIRSLHNIQKLETALQHAKEEEWETVIKEDLDGVDLCRFACSFGKAAYKKIAAQVIGEHPVPTWGSGQITTLADLYDCCQTIKEMAQLKISDSATYQSKKVWIYEKLQLEKEKQLTELQKALEKETKVLKELQLLFAQKQHQQ